MATVLTPAEIKQKITDWITTNGQGDITGAHLNTILAAIMDYVGVGYALRGTAPASAPSPDVPSAYLAAPGTYTNYESGDTVIPEGSLAVLKYDGSAWSKNVLKVCDPVSVSQNTITLKDWSANFAYVVGNQVQTGSPLKYYTCTTAHTSGNTFDSSKWQEITDLDNGGFNLLSINVGSETYPVYLNCIKLVGIGANATVVGANTVGDVYYSTTSHTLRQMTQITPTKVAKTLPFYDGAIYTVDGKLYVWDGADLVLKTKEISVSQNVKSGDDSILLEGNELARIADAGKLIRLEGVGSANDLITEIGQYFFSSSKNKIYRCISIHSPFTWDDFVEIPFYDGAIYTLDGELYVWENGILTPKTDENKNYVLYADKTETAEILSNASIYRKMPGDSTAVDDASGTRLRIIIPIESNQLINVKTSWSDGFVVALYDNETRAMLASNTCLQKFPFSRDPLKNIKEAYGITKTDGLLLISFSNGTTAISDATKQSMIESLTISFQLVKESIDKSLLFIGSLVNKAYTAEGLGDDTIYRATMQSAIAVPFESAEINIKMPPNYSFGIRTGSVAENLDKNSYWFGNGSRFVFPIGHTYYRISFLKLNGADQEEISTSDVERLIESGKIQLTYIDRSFDIINSNTESEKYVKAMMREFYSDASLNNVLPNLTVFGHTSDIHGDAIRLMRFARYCDYLGIDAALISGDFVAYNPSDGSQFINDIADKSNTPLLPCIGNHDARNLNTEQEQNEQIVGYLMTKNNVITPSGETYPTYYYKDFTDKKIRLIVLNTHELERSQRDACNITETQATWLISTLASTPQDYGVLLMYHELEKSVDMVTNHTEFYQPFETTLIYQSGITGNPITKIIDAFISKTSATISYTSQEVPISVTADFTSLNSGVEFIAHICGHEHVDLIGKYHDTTNYQLVLDVTCGVSIYGNSYPYLANISDLPRGGIGTIQDAFNIYGFDKVNKKVRIARVGSNITSEAKDRKCMIIPYVNS